MVWAHFENPWFMNPNQCWWATVNLKMPSGPSWFHGSKREMRQDHGGQWSLFVKKVAKWAGQLSLFLKVVLGPYWKLGCGSWFCCWAPRFYSMHMLGDLLVSPGHLNKAQIYFSTKSYILCYGLMYFFLEWQQMLWLPLDLEGKKICFRAS